MSKCRDILIIQTGGTIDKVYPQLPESCRLNFGEPAVVNILARNAPCFPYNVQTVCTKDSYEITEEDREDILRYVVEADQELVLITHGMTTMCETAKYLVHAGVGQGSKYGPGVGQKIVVLTGASKPECMKDSDADFNIGLALGFLQGSSNPGVFVAVEGSVVPGAHVVRTKEGKFVDDRDLLKRF
ncbi:uncharacterized protein LOC131944508 [Physella acuta]|uniref:uncharacterized protein LOC131944508 n=1 Tax=Physella acuta TaxID=109671 RepID=UPI0027DD995B|nr:uncharacterized protein LOC131944508 [Physella acuta]